MVSTVPGTVTYYQPQVHDDAWVMEGWSEDMACKNPVWVIFGDKANYLYIRCITSGREKFLVRKIFDIFILVIL